MDSVADIIERIRVKISNIGLDSTVVVDDELGEIHIAISSAHGEKIGKAHRNVRDSIRRRVARSARLSRYTVLLFLNPTHPGRACNTFVLPAGKSDWDRRPVKMLPDERLVA